MNCQVSVSYLHFNSVLRAERRISSSTVNWTREKALEFVNTGTEIGRGGAGVVYVNEAIDANVVIKASSVVSVCRDFGTDYAIGKRINDGLDALKFDDPLAHVVRVLAEFSVGTIGKETSNLTCFLVMERVHRPTGLVHGNASLLAYHAYMRNESGAALVVKGRGIYLGQPDIAKVIAPRKLEELATSLGSLLGVLHYGLLCDAGDMEYLLGNVDADETQAYVVAVDFDRVRFFAESEMTSEQVARKLEWSLDQEQYFPDADGPLFAKFSDAYLAQARKYKFETVAQRVLNGYAKPI